jgi:hypothetical protein
MTNGSTDGDLRLRPPSRFNNSLAAPTFNAASCTGVPLITTVGPNSHRSGGDSNLQRECRTAGLRDVQRWLPSRT